jgi:hypothetical protein
VHRRPVSRRLTDVEDEGRALAEAPELPVDVIDLIFHSAKPYTLGTVAQKPI